MRKYLIALGILFLLPVSANAASCFWVGGTATWDGTNTGGGGTGGIKWASASGGGTACGGGGTGGSPTSGDTATFDAASGGGTVTVNTTVNVAGITCGAFTGPGTLDFSVNNNNVTIGASSFNCSGTGTRTLNMGNGTWTISGGSGTPWNMGTTTNLTFNRNSSTIALQAPSGAVRAFNGGGLHYNIISIPASVAAAGWGFSGANTIETLNITAPATVQFPNGVITSITNAITWTGSSGSYISLRSSNEAQQATISSANNGSITWATLQDLAFTGGGTFTATNSFDLQDNSGITITAPSSGGGGGSHIIGGGL